MKSKIRCPIFLSSTVEAVFLNCDGTRSGLVIGGSESGEEGITEIGKMRLQSIAYRSKIQYTAPIALISSYSEPSEFRLQFLLSMFTV